MGARLYSPATARFLQVDPVFGGSCNAYDYVCQDPLSTADLSGSGGGLPPKGECSAGGDKWVSDPHHANGGYCVDEPHHSVVRAVLKAVGHFLGDCHVGWQFFEGLDFAAEAAAVGGLGIGAAIASIGAAEGSFGLSLLGLVGSFEIVSGAVSLGYIAYRDFSSTC